MTTDKLKYTIYSRLWAIWHMRARSLFDRFAPPCSSCVETLQVYKELAADGYAPAQRDLAKFRCRHAKYIIESRPRWHLCCNGDAGGWRTRVCDHLEHGWRNTNFYCNGE